MPTNQTMPREYFTISEAATLLGVSVDTIKRWERGGRLRTQRDDRNHRIVRAAEIERLRGDPRVTAGNKLRGVVVDVQSDGLVAQVELAVTDPVYVTAVITRDAAEALKVRKGMTAVALVEATSVVIQH